ALGAMDRATDGVGGGKATKRGDGWAALEPLYQGVRYAFGRLGKDVARGLTVRTDWGPQYTAHAFGAELRWLGIQHSPSFVGEPQCNGVIDSPMLSARSGPSSSATTVSGSWEVTTIAHPRRSARSYGRRREQDGKLSREPGPLQGLGFGRGAA